MTDIRDNEKDKKIEELKEIIVDLKIQLAKERIPYGHCPYCYYLDIPQEGDCDDCDKCKWEFFKKYEDKIRKDVEKL